MKHVYTILHPLAVFVIAVLMHYARTEAFYAVPLVVLGLLYVVGMVCGTMRHSYSLRTE
ncbi:hypothetical protein [Pontibacter harenae]|uniref:hypothetical protein n=1 Tax=Pontibacter harenae TaxID=2894083 RepID=UPI001E521BDF|nr:hypothetical protein [Pontibacter harenae]MCC9165347.1 hypothetical protein [Pontibacter harenae]